MNLKAVPNLKLAAGLKSLVKKENQLLHVIIEYIKEIDSRRLYFDLGYPSLFEYLTKEMKYSAGSAQRRIDAARLSREIPSVSQKIQAGTLNLHQVSELQRAVRQVAKNAVGSEGIIPKETKEKLIQELENKSNQETQKLISQELNIQPVEIEKSRVQKDESVRLELTLSKEQMAKLQKCKELLSHTIPGASMAEIIEALSDELIKRKDLSLPKRSKSEIHCHMEVSCPLDQISVRSDIKTVSDTDAVAESRTNISVVTKRLVFQRDRSCRYQDPETGHRCESRYLLQVDHKVPVWAGGGNNLKNLQLLCAAHNQQKYRSQSGLRRAL
jgi:5-methylcytosine-specific restriction endonuclease McrA